MKLESVVGKIERFGRSKLKNSKLENYERNWKNNDNSCPT